MQRPNKEEYLPIIEKGSSKLSNADKLSNAEYFKTYGVRRPNHVIEFTEAYEAARSGDFATVKEWVCKGKDIEMRHPKTRWSLLFVAAANNRLQIVTFLLSNGANANILSEPIGPGSFKPIDVASDSAVRAILSAASKPKLPALQEAEPSYDLEKFRSAYYGAASGQLNLVEAWVSGNARHINLLHPLHGLSLLHVAAQNNRKEIVLYLISKGADVGVLSRGYHSNPVTPSEVATPEILIYLTAAKRYIARTKLPVDFIINFEIPSNNPYKDECYKGKQILGVYTPTSNFFIKQISQDDADKDRLIELERTKERLSKELKQVNKELESLKLAIEKRAAEKKSDLLPPNRQP